MTGGGAKLPRVARPGCRRRGFAHGARRWRRRRPPAPAAGRASERARPASGAPARTMTSAPSSSTARSASVLQRLRVLLLDARRCRPAAGRARGCWPAATRSRSLDDFAVPGLDALRDRDDGEAVAQQVGAGQRRLGQADHRHRQHLAQAGEAGVAERGDDDRVEALRGARRRAGRRHRRRSAPRSGSRCRRRRTARSALRPSVPAAALRCASARISSVTLSEMLGLISKRRVMLPPARAPAAAKARRRAGSGRARPRLEGLPSHTTSPRLSVTPGQALQRACLRRACSRRRGAAARCSARARARPRSPGRRRCRWRSFPCADAGRRPWPDWWR